MASEDPRRELLRHTVATLAYRGGKAVREAPDSFATFRASETSRTPAEILAHIGDLLDWALSLAKGAEAWHNSVPQPWARDVDRFHAGLARFDEYLASGQDLGCSCERLFQGAIADALTHVGQARRSVGRTTRKQIYRVGESEPSRRRLSESLTDRGSR
jgi:hypothetical protein